MTLRKASGLLPFVVGLVSSLLAHRDIDALNHIALRRRQAEVPLLHHVVFTEHMGNDTFEQLLDHTDPGKGTFHQRYWWNHEHWVRPGSPVFLFLAGEANAEFSDLQMVTNETISWELAKEFGGAVVLLEHRYFGQSSPYDRGSTPTTETFQFLTVNQSIQDILNFAQTVALPFDSSSGHSNTAAAPWVLMGCSYTGWLTAMVQKHAPGTFAAYYSSSAPLQFIESFWQYYFPIVKTLPAQCVSVANDLIKYLQGLSKNETSEEIDKVVDIFQDIPRISTVDTVLSEISLAINMWQDDESEVFRFCSYLTNGGGTAGDARNRSLHALATWIKDVHDSESQRQLKQLNVEEFKALLSVRRIDWSAWRWLQCNEPIALWTPYTLDFTADGRNASVAPTANIDSLCGRYPYWTTTPGFEPRILRGTTVDDYNAWSGGWDATFEKVLFVVGEIDAWKEASLVSDY